MLGPGEASLKEHSQVYTFSHNKMDTWLEDFVPVLL